MQSTTSWAWHKLLRVTGASVLYSPALPLADNSWIPILQEALVKRTLSKFHLTTFGDLFPAGHIFSCTEDPRLRVATTMDHFVLLCVQKALRARLDSYPLEPTEFSILTGVIKGGDGSHLFARMYRKTVVKLPCRDGRVRNAWERDLGHPLTDVQWSRCCAQTRRVSPNHRHKLLHFKFLWRVYVTPSKLNRMDPSRSDTCPKCSSLNADFAHMTWT